MKDVSINRLDSPARRCVMHTREARCRAGRGRGRAPRAHADPVRGGSASPLKEGSAPNPDPSRLSLGSCRGLLPPDDLSGVVATRWSSIPLDPAPSSLPARALEQSHVVRPGNAAGATEAPETQPVAFEISFKPKPRRGPHNAPRHQRLTLTSYETQAQPQDPAPDPPAQNGPVQTASGWWVLTLSTQTGGWSPRPSTSGPHVRRHQTRKPWGHPQQQRMCPANSSCANEA